VTINELGFRDTVIAWARQTDGDRYTVFRKKTPTHISFISP